MLEDSKKNGFYDKAKFMEGASWICEKIIKELNNFDNQQQSMLDEFENRVTNGDHSQDVYESAI